MPMTTNRSVSGWTRRRPAPEGAAGHRARCHDEGRRPDDVVGEQEEYRQTPDRPQIPITARTIFGSMPSAEVLGRALTTLGEMLGRFTR
jgi:hypothetical protein